MSAVFLDTERTMALTGTSAICPLTQHKTEKGWHLNLCARILKLHAARES